MGGPSGGISLRLYIATRLLVGAGGAVAILLVLLWAKRFPGTTVGDRLFLISLSFVAGFVGYRLLPIVAAGLERKVNDLMRRTEETREIAQAAALENQMNGAVNRTITDLQKRDLLPLTLETDIRDLESVREEFPVSRLLHIVLGRAYRVRGEARQQPEDFSRAVAVLEAFVKKLQESPSANDNDIAAALYNIACYKCLAAGVAGTPHDTVSALKESALESLRRALQLDPRNALDAATDHDFDCLKIDPAFKDQFEQLIA